MIRCEYCKTSAYVYENDKGWTSHTGFCDAQDCYGCYTAYVCPSCNKKREKPQKHPKSILTNPLIPEDYL